LHADLLPALAELIADAGARGQVLVTTHADPLARALDKRGQTAIVRLTKREGATVAAKE
jgi:predicted ATPase